MDPRLLKIKKNCEAELDALATAHGVQTGEDRATAYVAICETDIGKRLVQSIDDATALLTKGPTQAELERLANEEKLRRKKKQADINDKELARRMNEVKG